MTRRPGVEGGAPAPASAAGGAPRATLVYDAGCGFCAASVRWLTARDRRGVFRLVARESAEGERELRAAGVDAARVDSVVLTRDGRAWLRSDAVLEALRLIGGPWSIVVAARLVPRPLRDAVYREIAHRRHAWSGRVSGGDPAAPGARRS